MVTPWKILECDRSRSVVRSKEGRAERDGVRRFRGGKICFLGLEKENRMKCWSPETGEALQEGESGKVWRVPVCVWAMIH